MNLDSVAVVVVTYSPGPVLDAFVASLDAAAPGIHLVLSDNGSTDGVPQRVAAERDNTALLVNPDNPGYGAAINAAVAQLAPQYSTVLVCNSDIELHPGALEALGDAVRPDDVACVGPRILDAEGSVYPSARRLPSIRDGVGHALFVRAWPRNPWTRRYLQEERSHASEPVATGWLSGACLLIKRDAFDAVGGFNDGFFMYFEDVDLGRRFGVAGYHNVFAPGATVSHIGGSTTSRYPERMLRAHHESAYRYLRNKHPEWWKRPALWVVRLGLAVRLRLEVRRALREHRRVAP